MPSSFTYQDALNYVGSQGFRMQTEQLAVFALNSAINMIWNAYDWPETLRELPPFWLNGDTQDYGPPLSAVPSDYKALRRAYLVNVDTGEQLADMEVKREIAETHLYAHPSSIGYIPEKNSFRVWPRPGHGMNPTQWIITGTYKKKPEKVTLENMGETFIFGDDDDFELFCQVLQYAMTPVSSPNKAPYLAAALQGIEARASEVGIHAGDPQGIAPAYPLAHYWGMR